MKTNNILPTFLTVLLSIGGISAQENAVSARAFFPSPDGPVPIKIPLPSYALDPKRLGFGGSVNIKVTIDENGKVSSIDEVGVLSPYCPAYSDPGIEAVRLAASNAAKNARFKPFIVEGKAARVSGSINYVFVPIATEAKGGALRMNMEDKSRSAVSQDTLKADPPTDAGPGGVLASKAIKIAQPPYPAAARAVRVSGSVNVQVVISEDGTVMSAMAVTGHPLLRAASEKAACMSKFSTVVLDAKPVKVSGIIVFNFNL